MIGDKQYATIIPPIVVKSNSPVSTNKVIVPSRGSFSFVIKSLDTGQKISFINPYMEPMQQQIQSGEEGFSRPFAERRHAQSVEAPSETWRFTNILFDIRYRVGAGKGQPISSVEECIKTLTDFTRPNSTRLRKHRLSVRWGQRIIGTGPGGTYLFLNSINPKTEMYDDNGNAVTTLLDLDFTEYGYQKYGAG